MKIQTIPSPTIPMLTLSTHQRDNPPHASLPGVVIGVADMVAQQPPLQRSLHRMYSGYRPTDQAYLVVPPEQMGSIFADASVQALLKAAAKEIAKQIHPHAGLVVDGCWLIFKALPLVKPTHGDDKKVRLFKVANLAYETLGLVGELNANFKIPAHWDNGVNFLLNSGEAFMEGKIPDSMEIAGWTDGQAKLLSHAFKIANGALNPALRYHPLQAQALGS